MENNKHFQMVARSIHWLADHEDEQPNLAQLAAAMDVSPFHLQKTFQTWAGVSPKQFLKFLTRESALSRLNAGQTVLDTALSTGLSGPGRLHDLTLTMDALTPGEVRSRGTGVTIGYGFSESFLGTVLVGWTDRGISFLAFCEEMGEQSALDSMQSQWQNARFAEEHDQAQAWSERIFENPGDKPLPLWLRGSPFQLKVWQALLHIPSGEHATYGQIAGLIGQPGAARAVGSAVGKNPISWLIPCHRVIREAGQLGEYRWGRSVKYSMIGLEAATSASNL